MDNQASQLRHQPQQLNHQQQEKPNNDLHHQQTEQRDQHPQQNQHQNPQHNQRHPQHNQQHLQHNQHQHAQHNHVEHFQPNPHSQQTSLQHTKSPQLLLLPQQSLKKIVVTWNNGQSSTSLNSPPGSDEKFQPLPFQYQVPINQYSTLHSIAVKRSGNARRQDQPTTGRPVTLQSQESDQGQGQPQFNQGQPQFKEQAEMSTERRASIAVSRETRHPSGGDEGGSEGGQGAARGSPGRKGRSRKELPVTRRSYDALLEHTDEGQGGADQAVPRFQFELNGCKQDGRADSGRQGYETNGDRAKSPEHRLLGGGESAPGSGGGHAGRGGEGSRRESLADKPGIVEHLMKQVELLQEKEVNSAAIIRLLKENVCGDGRRQDGARTANKSLQCDTMSFPAQQLHEMDKQAPPGGSASARQRAKKVLAERAQTFDESPDPIDPNSSREVVLEQLVKSQLRASNLASHLKDYRTRVDELRRLTVMREQETVRLGEEISRLKEVLVESRGREREMQSCIVDLQLTLKDHRAKFEEYKTLSTIREAEYGQNCAELRYQIDQLHAEKERLFLSLMAKGGDSGVAQRSTEKYIGEGQGEKPLKLISRNVRSSPTTCIAHYPYPKQVALQDVEPDDPSSSIYLKKSLKGSTILQGATAPRAKENWAAALKVLNKKGSAEQGDAKVEQKGREGSGSQTEDVQGKRETTASGETKVNWATTMKLIGKKTASSAEQGGAKVEQRGQESVGSLSQAKSQTEGVQGKRETTKNGESQVNSGTTMKMIGKKTTSSAEQRGANVEQKNQENSGSRTEGVRRKRETTESGGHSWATTMKMIGKKPASSAEQGSAKVEQKGQENIESLPLAKSQTEGVQGKREISTSGESQAETRAAQGNAGSTFNVAKRLVNNSGGRADISQNQSFSGNPAAIHSVVGASSKNTGNQSGSSRSSEAGGSSQRLHLPASHKSSEELDREAQDVKDSGTLSLPNSPQRARTSRSRANELDRSQDVPPQNEASRSQAVPHNESDRLQVKAALLNVVSDRLQATPNKDQAKKDFGRQD